MAEVRCLDCGSTNRGVVRKLSAIHIEGRGTAGGGSYTSELAIQLGPPQVPGTGEASCALVVAIMILLVGIVLVVAGGGSGLSIIGGLTVAVAGFFVFVGQRSVSAYTPELQAKMHRIRDTWNEAYYCSSDDIVFVPGHTWRGPPEAMFAVLRKVVEDRMMTAPDE